MGLVDYSDSDASDTEAPATKVAPPSKQPSHRVVDRSNPGRIKVTLPQAALNDEAQGDQPPAKRIKTGDGGFGGFNSFLPAPKRTGAVASTSGKLSSAGLGAGVSLKTGAAPGFSRDSEPVQEYKADVDEDGLNNESTLGNGNKTGFGLGLPPPKALVKDQDAETVVPKPADEVKLVGKPLIFKPLSVGRKPTKKKKSATEGASAPSNATTATQTAAPQTPAPKPKVSLFSMAPSQSISSTPASTGDYQPIIYEPSDDEEHANITTDDSGVFQFDQSYEEYTPRGGSHSYVPPAVPTPPTQSLPQSLSSIAGDLNLSAAERRQLFGRTRSGLGAAASATKIINFNTDQEYLHNEALRAAGEQAVHNPVRAIAPGKHSLKQLVSAAQNQKEALEESFAQGKNNRAEASSRYGW